MKEVLLPTVYPVTSHTDFVTQDTTFVVIKGLRDDGARFIELALQNGARTIVVEESQQYDHMLIANYGAQIVVVDNARAALAHLSAQAAGYPARKLKIIGVTGTKGKTTTVHVLNHILSAAGYKTACLTTVYNMINGNRLPAHLTTAQPDYLHQFFKVCVEQGVEYVIMEVAAQGFTFHRVDGIEFDAAIFTNLDQEHGELYPTQADYFNEKCKLFTQLKPGSPAVINADDVHGAKILEQYVHFFGISTQHRNAAIFAQFETETMSSYRCDFSIQGNPKTFEYSTFPGQFNGYNVLSAVATLLLLGIDLERLSSGLGSLPSLPGRLERYTLANGAQAFIDYAHTPASFQAVFATVRPWTDNLIVVFGAGGGKDMLKRPLMGAMAAQWADHVILTSDNPRYEEVETIIAQINSGIQSCYTQKVVIEKDRAQALARAYALSTKDSIIMVLGKGPDENEEIRGQVIPFEEKKILLSLR